MQKAEASGVNKISAMQRATLESIASKARLDEERRIGRHSRSHSCQASASSSTLPLSVSPGTSNTNDKHLDDLVETALHAMDDLMESQTAQIREQLYANGFEWGFVMDLVNYL